MTLQDMITPTNIVVGVTTLAAAVGAYTLYRVLSHRTCQGRKHPTTSLPGEVVGKVSNILIYPIKSARGLSLVSSAALRRGMEFDRRWVVINTNSRANTNPDAVGVGISMVNHPKMAHIESDVSIASGQVELTLNATGKPSVVLKEENTLKGALNTVQVNRMACPAYDCGDEAAEWLCDVLEMPDLRLYYMAEEQAGRVAAEDPKWGSNARPGDVVSFASFAPYLVCSEQSLKHVSSMIDHDLDIERFRPNIVIDCPQLKPHFEDDWTVFFISGIMFRIMKKCGRCPITQQHPHTGETDVKELLPKLREYQMDPSEPRHGNAPIFGIQVAADGEGDVSIGDVVQVCQP